MLEKKQISTSGPARDSREQLLNRFRRARDGGDLDLSDSSPAPGFRLLTFSGGKIV